MHHTSRVGDHANKCCPSWQRMVGHQMYKRPCLYRGARRQPPCLNAGNGESDAMKKHNVKLLKRLFYQPNPEDGPLQDKPVDSVRQDVFRDLPLWRVEWTILPGMQNILHVHFVHYVHMFEHVFNRGKPWRFGHLYLPSGSKNVCNPVFALRPGSQAPLIGALMEVNRAVRLMDGKLLLLATAVARFKVLRCLVESPYPRADVQLMVDEEELSQRQEAALQVALEAVKQQPSMPIDRIMQAAAVGAHASAAAADAAWHEYEYAVARSHEWADNGPREGANSTETTFLVTWIVEHGVKEVLPLPDGAALGRWDLARLQRRAEQQAQQQAAAAVAAMLQLPAAAAAAAAAAEQQAGGGTGAAVQGDAAVGVDGARAAMGAMQYLNPALEQGQPARAPTLSDDELQLTGDAVHDVLRMEALVWEELDTIAALTMRVRKNHLALPLGLLQLRPGSTSSAHNSGITSSSTSGSSSSNSSSPTMPLASSPPLPTVSTPPLLLPAASPTSHKVLVGTSTPQTPSASPPSASPPHPSSPSSSSPASPATQSSSQSASSASPTPASTASNSHAGLTASPATSALSAPLTSSSQAAPDAEPKPSSVEAHSSPLSSASMPASLSAPSSPSPASMVSASSSGTAPPSPAAPSTSPPLPSSPAPSSTSPPATSPSSLSSSSSSPSSPSSSSSSPAAAAAAAAHESSTSSLLSSMSPKPSSVPSSSAEASRPASTSFASTSSGSDAGSMPAAPAAPAPSPYQHAASEGLDVCADPHYPIFRRACKLTYAVTATFIDTSSPEQRQAFLECPTIVGRLKIVLHTLQQARNVLAARAALLKIQEGKHGNNGGVDGGGGS